MTRASIGTLSQAKLQHTERNAPLPVRIIAVDDDMHFREMLTQELEVHGFNVETFSDARSLLNAMPVVAAADVIVLEWVMRDLSGIELLPQLRSLGISQPVMFLTARAHAANEFLALQRGAIDFVDKARGIEIFLSRLQVVIEAKKTSLPPCQSSIQYGRLLLKPEAGRAFWDDVDLNLTIGEFRIVQLLVAYAGDFVTYRRIYDCLRYEGFLAGNGEHGFHLNVRSAIKRIRNKFRALDPDFADIHNHIALGYALRQNVGGARRPAGRGCKAGSIPSNRR